MTLTAVQSAIPLEAALLEFDVFAPFVPTAPVEAEELGAPHYVVRLVTNSYVMHDGFARYVKAHAIVFNRAAKYSIFTREPRLAAPPKQARRRFLAHTV